MTTSNILKNGFRPTAPIPTRERMSQSWSNVTVKNTSTQLTHIVIDRALMGHELAPGHKAELQMLNVDIERFRSMPNHDLKIDVGQGFAAAEEETDYSDIERRASGEIDEAEVAANEAAAKLDEGVRERPAKAGKSGRTRL